MDTVKLWKHERILWHNHFWPSLIAGVAVAIVTVLFDITVSNVILFASVGASATILTHTKSHHLTRLHTTITAYIIAIIVSLILHWANTFTTIPLALNVFLSVFITGLALFLTNTFHPPAISASLSFILLERGPQDLVWLFLAVILLLIIVRLTTYAFSQHLSLKEFLSEFERSF